MWRPRALEWHHSGFRAMSRPVGGGFLEIVLGKEVFKWIRGLGTNASGDGGTAMPVELGQIFSTFLTLVRRGC